MILDKSRNASPRLARWRTGTIAGGALALAAIATHIGPRVALASEPEATATEGALTLSGGDPAVAIPGSSLVTPADALPPVGPQKKIKIIERRSSVADSPESHAVSGPRFSRNATIQITRPGVPTLPNGALAAPAPPLAPEPILAARPQFDAKVDADRRVDFSRPRQGFNVNVDERRRVVADKDRRQSLERRVEQLERLIENLFAEESEDADGLLADPEMEVEHEFHIEPEEGYGFDENPFQDEDGFVWKSSAGGNLPDLHFDTEHFEKAMKEAEKAMKQSTQAYEKAIKDAHRRMDDQQKHRQEAFRQRIEPLAQQRGMLEARKNVLEIQLREIDQQRDRLEEELDALEDRLDGMEDAIEEAHEEPAR